MPIKMIVTDLDGTLLRNDKTVSDYTLDVFSRVRDKNIKIVFATARSDQAVSRLSATNIKPDALICYGGALVKVGGSIISRLVIPADVSDSLIDECVKAPEIYAIYAIGETAALSNDKEFLSGESGSADWSHYSFNDFSCPLGQSFLKISVRYGSANCLNELAKQYPMCDLMRYSGEDLARFANRDAVKWKALSALLEYTGISFAETAAFGDDFNDIEMLQNCGIGIAMENAIDDAKSAADYICGTNEEDGVARWLEKHCKIKC